MHLSIPPHLVIHVTICVEPLYPCPDLLQSPSQLALYSLFKSAQLALVSSYIIFTLQSHRKC